MFNVQLRAIFHAIYDAVCMLEKRQCLMQTIEVQFVILARCVVYVLSDVRTVLNVILSTC